MAKKIVETLKKDKQSRAYTLCFHNIKETGFDHSKIKQILNSFSNLTYYCIADEIGLETNKLHSHCFFQTVNPTRFSTVLNRFVGADLKIEESKGNAQQNRDYVFKTGKWANDMKAEQKLPETQEEWGTLPISQQGRRTDLIAMYDLVKEGKSNAEILEICGETAIKHVDKINKLRHDYLVDKFKGTRRLDLKVHYITGKTGTGKSRDILDTHGDSNVYRVTDYQHPFDSYQLEPVIVFEEFRSSLRLQDMLNFLDIYPVNLPARYSPRVCCASTIYIVSNWDFEQQYSEIQKDPDQKSTYQAWIRRFNGYAKVYYDLGKYIEYDSIQSYLKRNEDFQPVTDDVPFD